jgi:hypothetical protein
VILCTCWPSVSFEAGLSSKSIVASSFPLLFLSLGGLGCEALTILNMTGRSFTAAVFNASESPRSPLSPVFCPSTESTSVAILLQINVCWEERKWDESNRMTSIIQSAIVSSSCHNVPRVEDICCLRAPWQVWSLKPAELTTSLKASYKKQGTIPTVRRRVCGESSFQRIRSRQACRRYEQGPRLQPGRKKDLAVGVEQPLTPISVSKGSTHARY